jgi:peptidoglycan/xylan/chitin deacetylase (PgdA/CDA1 family)
MFHAKELNGTRLRYEDGEYSLTFDDGPTERVTLELARLLQRECISATFFVLGERANDEILSELVACGQRIGNHTFSHPNFDLFIGDHRTEIPRQIAMCHERIERFSREPIPFRAPGGAWANPRFTKIANRPALARRYVGRYGWDVDASDWRLHRRKGHADKIEFAEFCDRFEAVVDRVRRGIILLHDGVPLNEGAVTDCDENQVIRVTEFVIETIRRRGLRLTPLKEPSMWPWSWSLGRRGM